MNGNSFRTLEFDTIRELLAGQAGSAEGRRLIRQLRPFTEAGAVREALARTAEARRLLGALGAQPYHDLPDVDETLASARVEGFQLEPRDLLDAASFIEGAREIARAVTRFAGAPRLARRASEVADASDVAAAIRRAVLPSAEVADDASPRLAETRRELARLRLRLTSVMESYLRGKDADRVLQDKLVTTRNDRYVLLLRADHRGQIPGIIHGSSGSGASLFVEPMPAVELNNDIVSLQDEERREVARILRELTSRLGARAAELARAVGVLGELDAAQAMALLAREMEAVEPTIHDAANGIDLIEARHPLLMPVLTERLGLPPRSRRAPVPVTLRVSGHEPVLVISGPNTGGKTVALKTLGLLALMAQSGLHVPAAEGSALPVFERLYADIGDDQSIAANLSTFSAHLASIVEMMADLAPPALVLLDEVGAGTDPAEGGALGVAIVEHFRGRGAMVVATTHHGSMKAYAQSTPGVGCASFGYDPRNYEPTYRLVLGTPGRSLALEMAERLGLPAQVVRDARARLDDRELRAEALLKKLEADQAAALEAQERLARERRELEDRRAELGSVERELANRKRTQAEAFSRELARRREEQARQVTEAIRLAVERVERSRRSVAAEAEKARGEALRRVREAGEAALRDVVPDEAPPPDVALGVGLQVRVQGLGVVGQVIELLGHDQAEVSVAGKKLRVPRSELRPLAAAPARAPRTGAATSAQTTRRTAPAEVNLVGLSVDEALPRVDKLLDDAFLAERREIRVIHGFGAGRLRQAVAELLAGHPHVASYRVGAEGRGGVTVVELRD